MHPAHPRRCHSQYRGFTLTEVLVVISIIAVLTGLLIAGVVKARSGANVFVIKQHVSDIEGALELFRKQHSFYPPDFTRIREPALPTRFPHVQACSNRFLPFLNRYAPNHAEASIVPPANLPPGYPANTRRIDIWWDQVGDYLGPESAVVFWLSGISKNKQFPLTFIASNGRVTALPPYNVQVDNQTFERDLSFDFKSAGHIPVFEQSGVSGDARTDKYPALPPLGYPIWDTGLQAGYVCASSQLNDGSPEPVIYFELASFRPTVDPYPTRLVQIQGSAGLIGPYATPGGQLYAADKFQLITPGLDSYFFAGATSNTNISQLDKWERDNISNFTDGPLENVIIAR